MLVRSNWTTTTEENFASLLLLRLLLFSSPFFSSSPSQVLSCTSYFIQLNLNLNAKHLLPEQKLTSVHLPVGSVGETLPVTWQVGN